MFEYKRSKLRIIPYILWFGFYILLFGSLTMFLIVPFYLISLLIAFCTFGEALWRKISGVRPPRIKAEKTRLVPLFEEVYKQALEKDIYLPEGINIFIQESMSINAMAYGESTLVITKGSFDLLSDDCIKGMLAHELGHFSNRDPSTRLILSIGNMPMTLLMRALSETKRKLDEASKNTIVLGLFKTAFNGIYYIFRGIEFIGELLLMPIQRQNEYDADMLAFDYGYGAELAEALTQIYQISMSGEPSVKEMIRSSHPPVTKRIDILENLID